MEIHRVPEGRRWGWRRLVGLALVALLLLNAASLGRFLLDVAHWRDDPVAARRVLSDRLASDKRVTNAATVLSRVALDAIHDLQEVASRDSEASEHARNYLRQIREEVGK